MPLTVVTISRDMGWDKTQSVRAYCSLITPCFFSNTLQPLYNTVLVIQRFKDGSQKCIDYIEK